MTKRIELLQRLKKFDWYWRCTDDFEAYRGRRRIADELLHLRVELECPFTDDTLKAYVNDYCMYNKADVDRMREVREWFQGETIV